MNLLRDGYVSFNKHILIIFFSLKILKSNVLTFYLSKIIKDMFELIFYLLLK